jgi:hypothetical protein|tara:strand:+ start:473 stop:646 length:174 start_codon:yes stop_codon:yes gene_type:complete
MKKYIVEFTHSSGEIEKVELTTDRLEWSIQQWKRNRSIVKHEIINEDTNNSKQMLFG